MIVAGLLGGGKKGNLVLSLNLTENFFYKKFGFHGSRERFHGRK